MRSVYVETTVVSYLTANPSRDLVVAAHQQVTREWWEKARLRFDLHVSALADCYHLALASWHGMDYLVSWNMKHIVNGDVILAVQEINAARGIRTPLICTPEELVEDPWSTIP